MTEASGLGYCTDISNATLSEDSNQLQNNVISHSKRSSEFPHRPLWPPEGLNVADLDLDFTDHSPLVCHKTEYPDTASDVESLQGHFAAMQDIVDEVRLIL